MISAYKGTNHKDWLKFHRDRKTGIESINAHFHGHAYDSHDHNELLVGITQQGLQQFTCHHSLHISHPGRAILIEPGAVHDGHAAGEEGFTYAMLYFPQAWISEMLQRRNLGPISSIEPAFHNTLADDPILILAIQHAFIAIHYNEGQLARDQSLDHLMTILTKHIVIRSQSVSNDSIKQILRLRDYLHDHMAQDIGLEELAYHCGIDSFRLTRQFKKVFGKSPHTYLVHLRLRTARMLLAQGEKPALVALMVGFSDQSHMGCWFQRAYRLSPAFYQKQCTNILDE